MKHFRKVQYASYWRGFCILLTAGFLLGIIFCAAACRFRQEEIAGIHIYWLENFTKNKPNANLYFYFLIPKRVLPVVVGMLLGLTIFGGAYSIAMSLGYGFFLGIFFAIAVAQNGIPGLLLFVGALFPQGFFYLLSGLQLLAVISLQSDLIQKAGGAGGRGAVRYILWCVLCLSGFLWGVFVESYVNPKILSYLVRIL